MDLYTFNIDNNRLTFVVKHEFLKTCPSPTTVGLYELMTEFKLCNFLHNPSGPAITHNNTGKLEFWRDGVMLSKEESEKLLHNYKFNNKVQDQLNDK